MNKKTLIETIAKKADYSKAEIERFLNLTFESVKKIVKKDGKLQLVGVGTFQVKKRAARMGRNPQTGKAIKILAKKVVKFKASKDFL